LLTCSAEEQEREIWIAQPGRLLLAVAVTGYPKLGSEARYLDSGPIENLQTKISRNLADP
jgi:hypothetical protein